MQVQVEVHFSSVLDQQELKRHIGIQYRYWLLRLSQIVLSMLEQLVW